MQQTAARLLTMKLGRGSKHWDTILPRPHETNIEGDGSSESKYLVTGHFGSTNVNPIYNLDLDQSLSKYWSINLSLRLEDATRLCHRRQFNFIPSFTISPTQGLG